MTKLDHLLRLGFSYAVTHATRLSYPPYQFTIEPTNICNLACVFCPQSRVEHRTRRRRGHLKPDDFTRLVRRIGDSGSSNRHLNLTLDGEPFLNPHFLDFVAQANGAGYFPVFATNGILLDREKTDGLIVSGAFRASIDMASDEKIFESIRGRPGDFARLRENLAYLIEQAGKRPGIYLDIHDITPYAGVDPEESLPRLKELFPGDIPRRVRFFTRRFHNFCGHLDFEHRDNGYRICPYPWTQMAVTFEGDCVACCRDTAGRSILGNILQEPVMAIWNNERYQTFRKNLIERHPELNAACRECDLPFSGSDARWKPRYLLRSLLGR